MKEKFLVKIPLDPLNDSSNEYKEIKFKTHQEIADFLQVSMNSVKTLISGQLKFILPKIQHLKGIKIERIGESDKDKPKLTEEEEKERAIAFQKKLLDKIK